MTVRHWIHQNTTSLAGKIVAISGATGGLGNALVRHLAALGADLLLLDRNPQKSQALADSLTLSFPSLSVRLLPMDLEDMASVRAAAEALMASPPDFLILNAGAYHIPRHLCDTGLDNVFQINFAAPYYLARRLLPHIRARGGRIVAVGSIAHTYTRFCPENPSLSSCKKSSHAYGNAKRLLMFSLYGLSSEGGLSVTHPGITLTGITAHYPKAVYALIKHPMRVIFMRPRKASLSILCGLFEDCGENEWIGPRLFGIWGFPKKSLLRTCPPEEAAAIRQMADKVFDTLSLTAQNQIF